MNEPTQAPWLTDRYIPQVCLGRKAGRQTWLATDRVTGNPVVVKKLSFGRDFLWDDLKLFEREAQTLKSINHPAIPTYLDFFDLESKGDQGFALVQSYIDARSLEEHVKSGRRFSEADLREIATQILEILDYLHHCQPPVIHRDIKPSNILLAESDNGIGIVYLVDFGSVQSLAAREGSTITIVGTYGYMPPEQFGGRAYPTSDFYSLGATLIYLATGKHPADIPQGKDLRLNFEPLANLSLEMTGWIREMIHPLADERPDSARSAVQSLCDLSTTVHQLTPVKSQLIECLKIKSYIVKYAASDSELNLRIPEDNISLLNISNGNSVSIGPPREIGVLGCMHAIWALISLCTLFMLLLGLLHHSLLLFAVFCIGSIIFEPLINLIREGIKTPKNYVHLNLEGKFLTIDWDQWCRHQIPNLKFANHEILKLKTISYRQSIGKVSTKQISFIEIESNDIKIRINTHQDESRWLAAELGAFLKLPVTVSGEKIL
jgi:serine/threonine protein kinase